MSTARDIAVVLVGFNSRRHLETCLSSLGGVDWGKHDHEIIYVDNASTDGSVEMVRERFPSVRIIANDNNAGFCRACNQAVASTSCRYIYLLNNDTRVLANSIAPLADFLDSHAGAGAVANRLLNPDGTDQWSGRRFPTWVNAFAGRRTPLARRLAGSKVVRDYLYKDLMARGEAFEADWIPGSCTMVRRKAYSEVGGLPENMHYWSDAVFCRRLRAASWPVFVLPSSSLIHFEGEGSGKTPAVRRWLIADFHQGAYRFYCEHYQLGPWSLTRWLAKAALGVRARLLMMSSFGGRSDG